MRVFIDGRPLDVPSGTLKEALHVGREAAQAQGRVIVEVGVDGSPASDSLLDDPPDRPVGDELRLVTADRRMLVAVTLEEAADALEAARGTQVACGEEIQSGALERALPRLAESIQVWESARRAIEEGATLAGLDLAQARVEVGGSQHAVMSLVGDLRAHLESLRRALSAQDWAAVADALLYDLPEQCDVWSGAMRQLSRQVRERSS